MVMSKDKSVSGFLEKLGKLNDEKIKVFLPSLKKSIEVSPLTLKQQKDLISSSLDGVKGAFFFSRTLNDIIINNTGNYELKTYDRFPIIAHLRKHSLGSKIRVDEKVVNIDTAIKNFKTVPHNIKDEHIVSLKTLKVHLRIPTLSEENTLLKKGERDAEVTKESSREGVALMYVLELLKYVDKIVVEGEEIDFDNIKINDRIKLIEELPLTMYKDISKYIEQVNAYTNEIMTVDETVIPVDVRFFDTSGVD